jgi:hypothetical protein
MMPVPTEHTARPSCAVVYLARGLKAGLESATGFFNSYDQHPAGWPHELVVIVKGWAGVSGLAEVKALAAARGAFLLALPDDGLDLGAYFRAAEMLDCDRLLFLNSHSRVRYDDWLKPLNLALDQPGVGAAACSGNWCGLKITTWADLGAALKYARIRLLLKAPLTLAEGLFRAPGPPAFVNPHLRTNAFLTPRKLWLEFYSQSKFPTTKADCCALEYGRQGFTRFLEQKGLKPLVVGADGRGYEVGAWVESGTFYSPGLANLLIHDNQGAIYLGSSSAMRQALEVGCWGRRLTDSPGPGVKEIVQNWRTTLSRYLARLLGRPLV